MIAGQRCRADPDIRGAILTMVSYQGGQILCVSGAEVVWRSGHSPASAVARLEKKSSERISPSGMLGSRLLDELEVVEAMAVP